MKKVLVYIAVMVGVVILLDFFMGCTKPELPPGYKLMCAIGENKYTIWIPCETLDAGGFISPNVEKSETEAIKNAIRYEDYRYRSYIKPYINKSDAYDWEECQQGKD